MSRPPKIALCAVAASLLLAAPAGAAYDPVGSGVTQLRLDRSFLALLKRNGVSLKAQKPASIKGGVVSFPVEGGKFDPLAATGTVEHGGALSFVAAGRSLPLRALQVKTSQRHAPLSAKVGGGQLKLASTARVIVARHGFGDRVKTATLLLSAKLAGRLEKKLRLRGVFAAGQPLGISTTEAELATVSLSSDGHASFVSDPGFLAKLSSLFVALNPIFPAEHLGAEFALPIFGGELALDGSGGSLETSGALELLQLGGGQVFWHEPRLDFDAHALSTELDVEPSPPYVGKAGSAPIGALAVAPGALVANSSSRSIVSQGLPVTLDAAMAANLNQAFAVGKPVFVAGEAVGVVSFSAKAQ